MRLKEFIDIRPDVDFTLETYKDALEFGFKVVDKANPDIKEERVIPFSALPLEVDEIVLEDYICSVLEQLYQKVKLKRDERTIG